MGNANCGVGLEDQPCVGLNCRVLAGFAPPRTKPAHCGQFDDRFPDVLVSARSAKSMDRQMSKSQNSDVPRVARVCSLVLAVTFVAFTSGCGPSIDGAGPGHRPQALALTPYEELELGRRAFAEVLRSVPTVSSGPDVERVARIGNRIARAVEIEPLQREINLNLAEYQFEWQYCVIESGQINAFCMPGGKIGVFTGLLRLAENDDQLAAVIAHEVAHAVAHHISERIARSHDLGRGLMALSFDREQELEADHIGAFLMTFAGYSPHGAVTFWQEMELIGTRRAQLPEFLSDHPADQRRLDQLRGWLPRAEAAYTAYKAGRIAPVYR
jgi:metalloendopeptidase OMA1, mitochondrial